MSNYFYASPILKNSINADLIEFLREYSTHNKSMIYVLNKPLTDNKYDYSYKDVLIVLCPLYSIQIIDLGGNEKEFDDFYDELIEDLIAISGKYNYKKIIGRSRDWELLIDSCKLEELVIENIFENKEVVDPLSKRQLELLISLFIGSINDIEKFNEKPPIDILEKIRQNIQLFDAEQTQFLFDFTEKKRYVIQGLSGTGKTELLLHKLKELYTSNPNSKISISCHNKILADKIKKRIPEFFTFMKVDEQIDWESRLWCTNAWGRSFDVNSGVYRKICDYYNIPFGSFSYVTKFSTLCKRAIDEINSRETKKDPLFTYMLIDEAQDFDENYFELCQLVTEKNIFIAGDLFQNIFEEISKELNSPDLLLGKCYRTDPRTLMFAHGLGMGLFEKKKLKWLDKEEWEGCGYIYRKESSNLILSREPVKRFDVLDESFESFKIVPVTDNYSDTIVNIIKDIIIEFPTFNPDDLGIIFLDETNDKYRKADILESKIKTAFNYNVNKSYESKQNIPNTILIANKNNVKGLEFPFVICITSKIGNSISYRNSLYTMLTRSFLRTYMVIQDSPSSGLTKEMTDSLVEINTSRQMTIEIPTEPEIEQIKSNLKFKFENKSTYDKVNDYFKANKWDVKHLKKILHSLNNLESSFEDDEDLYSFISLNYKILKK